MTMSEIRFVVFSSKRVLSCLGKKIGPRHCVCSSPDCLSCPFSFLPLASYSRHKKHHVQSRTSPGKRLLQMHYCCGLKSHHQSTWHTPTVLRQENEWLNRTVVHTPLDEGLNFPRESVFPTSNMERLRKGEI